MVKEIHEEPNHHVTIPGDGAALYPAFPNGVNTRECFHSRPFYRGCSGFCDWNLFCFSLQINASFNQLRKEISNPQQMHIGENRSGSPYSGRSGNLRSRNARSACRTFLLFRTPVGTHS